MSEYKMEDRKAFLMRMENEGFDVCYPENNELFIDLDTEEQYQVFLKQWESLMRFEYDWTYKVSPSKSGLPRRHIRVDTDIELSDAERIAWQAALGSDILRELLSLVRLDKQEINPTIFIEKKE